MYKFILGAKLGLLGLTIIFLVCLVVSLPFMFLDYLACKDYGSISQRNTKWSVLTSCYAEHNGKFIPIDEFNKRATTNEKESQ